MKEAESPPAATRIVGSLGIRQKLSVTFSLVILLVMLLTVLLVTHLEKGASLERARTNAIMLGNLVRISMGEDIIRGNYRGLEFSLKEFSRLPVVRYCAILNRQGKVISSTEPDLAGKFLTDEFTTGSLNASDVVIRRAFHDRHPVSDACIPVRLGGESYGVIRLGFSLKPELDYLRTILLGNLTLGLLFILIGILISYSISRNILSPIGDLLAATEKVGHGDLTIKTDIQTADEFEQLGASFNRMTVELKKKELLRRFVSQAAWEEIESSSGEIVRGGKRQEIAVLFSDIQGFTTFTERHQPEEVIDYLNLFFDDMVRAIAESGGVIDKFIGDCIMGVFLPSEAQRWGPELRSIFAALRMKRYLWEFNIRQAELGLEEFQTGIGINSGPVVLGSVGSASRLEFTALGDTVNLASRLEGESRSGTLTRIFLSGALRNRVRNLVNTVAIGERKVKGKSETIEVFEVASLGNLPLFIEEFHRVPPKEKAGMLMLISFVGTPEARKFLEQTVLNAPPELAGEAIRALGSFVIQKSEEAKAFLMQILSTRPDEILQSQAVAALELAREPRLAGFFSEHLRSQVPRVRANALQALLSLDFPGKAETFRGMADDPHPRVVASSLLGLWLLDDPSVLPGLSNLLASADSGRRTAGAFAVATLAASHKFRILFEARGGVPATLSQGKMIQDTLLTMLQAKDPSERLQAARALGSIGGEAAFGAFTTIVEQEKEVEILAEAERALKRLEARLGGARTARP